VLARLLGIKLLTLEGTVLVSPTRVQGLDLPRDVSTSGPQSDGPDPSWWTRDAGSSATRPDAPVGARLELSARLLDECADELRGLDQR
jgi:hypothetical protein